ncbi:site-specific integrase [Moritella viscosa]|uniref:Phage integrase family protein n=1 Tax=Moritella viscosa TaxID=80854 RepID=A0A1K9ZHF7_9GAMM|nr:site-specific integrase [Moritella viscosa]SGY94695.1 Phage integrase family protein [Moritella viscosa]
MTETKVMKQPYINLHDGLAILKVAQSKQWRIYLKLEGQKALRFSLKTPDQAEATKLAWKEYTLNSALLENGEVIKQPKSRLTLHQVIDKLIDDYLKLQEIIDKEKKRQEKEGKEENNNKKQRVGNETHSSKIRHWKRIKAFYDEKMRPSALSTEEVRDYFYNLDMLSNTQFKIIKFCFIKIFEKSLELQLIKHEQVVNLKNIEIKTKDMESRDVFTKTEFNLLFMYAITGFKTSGKGIHTNKMCIMASGFIYHTGIRIGEELLGIKWSDLKKTPDGHLFCVIRKGKTSNYKTKNRKVLLDASAHAFLLFVAKLKHPDLIKGLDDYQTIMYLSKIKYNEQVFATKYSKTPDYRTTFNKWIVNLKEDGYLYENKNYVMYSLRHSYITNALEDNIPLTVISDSCGTSLKMIQEHYSHTSVMSQSAIEYLMKEKLMLLEMSKPVSKELTAEEIQKEKNILLDLVELEFPSDNYSSN